MKLTRTLKDSFIKSLNILYASGNSWWRKIADDKDVFILIRNNEIRVQSNGGLLLQINQNANNKIICKAREDFLVLTSKDKPYVIIDETPASPIKSVGGLNDFVEHYESVKRRIGIFTEEEKKVVQYLSNNRLEVVDIEVGFEGDFKEDAKKKSAPRIDMAAITGKGKLVFFEIKLFDNSEIKSKNTPNVVGQLNKYKKLLSKNKDDIVDAYKAQLKIYEQLDGNFFETRREHFKNLIEHIDKIVLYPEVRLVITGFDEPQRKIMLPAVCDGIEKGLGWGKGSKDLITTGDHKNLTKSNRLFLGL